MRTSVALSLLVVIAGCGSSAPKVEEPKAQTAAAPVETAPKAEEASEGDDAKAEEKTTKVPDGCEGDGGCVMPRRFVAKLCAGVFPELALMFFQKGTPWRRAYLAVKEATPFNGLNGPSSEQKLVFEEEMLVLSEKKADTGGMQVSGAGSSFDLLRWDGTCATLSAEEVRFATPPKPKNATIPWRILEDATQNALLQNEAFAKVAAERRKECKGATIGAVTDKCEKADKKLNALLVEVVRGGASVPQPAKVP